jgi:hypothetical protein
MNEILKCVKTSTACSFYICDVFPVFYILCDICLATYINSSAFIFSFRCAFCSLYFRKYSKLCREIKHTCHCQSINCVKNVGKFLLGVVVKICFKCGSGIPLAGF